MLTLQHRESLIQRAHICALAAQAGANLAFESIFDYGTDGCFSGVKKLENGSLIDNGARLDFQLKATTDATISEKTVSFSLKSNDYNKLVERMNSGPPIMLILLVLPKNESEWASFSINNTVLRKCCFWKYLFDEKPTSNKSSKTVTFPIENTLTPEIISSNLDRIANENAALLSQSFGGHRT